MAKRQTGFFIFILSIIHILFTFYSCENDESENTDTEPAGLTFIKTFSDYQEGYCAENTSDNGYIITGSGMNKIFLLKTDYSGNIKK